MRHDCLEPPGLGVAEAAKQLGVSRRQLSDVLNGHSGISSEMAVRLDKAFGGGETGVTAVIQLGGSVRDEHVIAATDANGLAMVFTGMRHFRR